MVTPNLDPVCSLRGAQCSFAALILIVFTGLLLSGSSVEFLVPLMTTGLSRRQSPGNTHKPPPASFITRSQTQPIIQRGNHSDVAEYYRSQTEPIGQRGNHSEYYRKIPDVLSLLESPVILCVANFGYTELLYNLLFSIQNLDIKPRTPDILVVCSDKRCYREMESPKDGLLVKYHLTLTDMAESDERASIFRDQSFNQIVQQKPKFVKRLIERGLDVLFVDSDIVLLGNPFLYFTGNAELYVQQEAYKDHICSGFYFMRATPHMTSFISRWISNMQRDHKQWDDQPYFIQAFRKLKNKMKIETLPINLFMSGKVLQDGKNPWYDMDVRPVEIHANFVTGLGEKQRLLKENKLWFLPN